TMPEKIPSSSSVALVLFREKKTRADGRTNAGNHLIRNPIAADRPVNLCFCNAKAYKPTIRNDVATSSNLNIQKMAVKGDKAYNSALADPSSLDPKRTPILCNK